jgi:hypothetical protein
MTTPTHTFDVAAALLDQAIERLATRDYGITRILWHEFGECVLNANHTRHDTGHTVKMWAYDEHGVLAAAEASAPHVGGTPQGRIVNFRAAHLTFGVIDTDSPLDTVFFARGRRGAYQLDAHPGSSAWTLSLGDEQPRRFDTLDDAVTHIVSVHEQAAA